MSNHHQTLKKAHCFSLLDTGVDDLTQKWLDALDESECDDATVGIQNGLIFLDFDREASTFREALTTAIDDVERSGVPIQLVRVDPGLRV